MRLAHGSPEIERIDAALSEWRQGDIAAEEYWFIHAADSSLPLTSESAAVGPDGIQSITSEVEGLVVITQSCDIVRPYNERRFIEASPLVEVPELQIREIERGRRPAYAFVPAVRECLLVADLDRVMTVEKAVVAGYYLDKWKELILPAARFSTVDWVVCGLEDLTARDYVESDPLDLDYLSERNG